MRIIDQRLQLVWVIPDADEYSPSEDYLRDDRGEVTGLFGWLTVQLNSQDLQKADIHTMETVQGGFQHRRPQEDVLAEIDDAFGNGVWEDDPGMSWENLDLPDGLVIGGWHATTCLTGVDIVTAVIVPRAITWWGEDI